MAKVINLLPKQRQQEIRYGNILKVLVLVIALSLTSYGAVFLAQFGVKFYLAEKSKQNAEEIAQIQAQVNKNDNAKIKSQIKQVNDTISDYQTLAGNSPKWSKVLKAFAKLPPQSVRITSFSADATTKLVNISGFSPSREGVMDLYNSIKADDAEFINVDYPLENVAKAQNINFHFSFYIKDTLLK